VTAVSETWEWWEWERPRPAIRAMCKVCGVTQRDVDENRVAVSPTGMAHFGQTGGGTACGKDATPTGWWWPL
jgi:hypothetical protein